MTKDREKAIKLYWNIAKERCPFHENEKIFMGFCYYYVCEYCGELILTDEVEK